MKQDTGNDQSRKPTEGEQASHGELTEEQKKRLEELIEEEEGVTRKVVGFWNIVITVLAVGMSGFAIYSSVFPVTTQILRGVHVAFLLALSFLYYPFSRRFKSRITLLDIVLALLAIGTILYMLIDFEQFIYRAVTPEQWDIICGVAFILLILEATRRSSGWIMPVTCIIFLLYAYFGPWLPAPWTHRGYDIERIVGHMYMTLEGIFGVPIDVCSTIIIMFCIFGAFLSVSGAGKFYVDVAFAAMGRKPTAAGRAVVATSYFLAMASGSGVANTVAIGSVAYPMLKKAGYDKDNAGGFLAAGGMGAITTPPVMGAAAFLIAEFLRISYVDVILLALIPAALYYWGLLLMVEFDAKKFGLQAVEIEKRGTVWQLTKNVRVPLSPPHCYRWFSCERLHAAGSGFRGGPYLFLRFIRPQGVEVQYTEDNRGAETGFAHRAQRCRYLRVRGHHRWRGESDRPRLEAFHDHNRLRRRQSRNHGNLYGAPLVDHRVGRADHGHLHYCRCDRSTGPCQTRGARLRRTYVYLLLRASL